MTAIIFYTGFISIYGFIIGKSFKRLNPFLMLLGMFFSIPVIAQVEQSNQPLLYIPFAIGFFTNFGNPFRKVTDFFAGIKMDIERFFANRRYKKEQKNEIKNIKKNKLKSKQDEKNKQNSRLNKIRKTQPVRIININKTTIIQNNKGKPKPNKNV